MNTSSFFLKCLGYPELRTGDGRIVRIRVRKHLALLVYLAVERNRFHDRDHLVDLLWPGPSQERGRHSCANALSVLRRIVGAEAFTATPQGIRFLPAGLSLDLDYLSQGEFIGLDGEAQIDVDGFLAGFDLADAPEFGLWKEREHARRLPAIHTGLLALIDHGRRRGSHEEISRWADRLLALDHLAEEGTRARMEAMALVGDRVGALRIFDEWKAQLHAELGAEPSMVVEGMAAQLRKRQWEPRAPTPIPAVPAEQWRDRKFVGRKTEYRRLYETWESAHSFRPRHLLVAGDSGVGKTTLAQRLVTAAGLEGASVARIQCYEMEQRIPFATIGGLVAGLLGRPGAAATAPESLAEVARIVPQVKQHFATLPEPTQAEGESARLLFAEGVVELLRALVEERPVLLVIDDLHYSDEASSAVLHLVLRRLAATRFLVVVTARTDGRAGLQFEHVSKFADAGLFQPLTLEPMSVEESSAVLDDLLPSGSSISATERRALIRAARGYPIVIELLAADWRSNETESLAIALRAMTVSFEVSGHSPLDAIDRLVERLLGGIGATARRIINFVAVIGPHTADPRLFEEIGLSTSEAIDGLAELTARRVLRAVGSSIEFNNELVRAAIYRAVPPATRACLHSQIAALALSGRTPLPSLAIAWHLMRANRAEEAATQLLSGAEIAISNGAPDDAILALRSGLPDMPPHRRPAAHGLLAYAYREIGAWREVLASIEKAHPASDRPPQLHVLALESRWRSGALAPPEFCSLIDQCLSISGEPSEFGGRALSIAASLAGSASDEARLRAVAERAAGYRPASSHDEADRLSALAIASYYLRALDDALRWADLARSELRNANVLNAASVNLEMGTGIVYSSLGRYAEALALQLGASELAYRIGNEQLQFQATTNACLAALRLGAYDRVADLAARGKERDQLLANPALATNTVNLYYAAACAAALTGRGAAAMAEIAMLPSHLVQLKAAPWLEQVAGFYRADVLWLAGDRGHAVATARQILAAHGAPLSRGVTGSYFRWVSLAGQHRETLRPQLEAAFAESDRLDVIDRLEVSTALAALEEDGTATAFSAAVRAAETHAKLLPKATIEFVQAFVPLRQHATRERSAGRRGSSTGTEGPDAS